MISIASSELLDEELEDEDEEDELLEDVKDFTETLSLMMTEPRLGWDLWVLTVL